MCIHNVYLIKIVNYHPYFDGGVIDKKKYHVSWRITSLRAYL